MIFPSKKQTGSSPFEMELHRTRGTLHGERPYVDTDSRSSREGVVVIAGKEKNVEV